MAHSIDSVYGVAQSQTRLKRLSSSSSSQWVEGRREQGVSKQSIGLPSSFLVMIEGTHVLG